MSSIRWRWRSRRTIPTPGATPSESPITESASPSAWGSSDEQMDVIRNAGILHDVGKIGISETILQKPGPLTEQELIAVQDHPAIGEKICKPLAFGQPAADRDPASPGTL